MRHRHPVAPFLLLLPLWSCAGLAAQDAGSSFGHARARELAALGRLPTRADVVVRDLVNYHRHRLPLPAAGRDLALDVRFDRGDAARGDELWVQLGYTTASLGDRALAPPSDVVLVVDVSGSMAEAGKMTAVQAGLRAFVDRLRADDAIALVTFSTEARLVEPLRARGDGRWLHRAIDELVPDGNTNLHGGLLLGLRTLARGDDSAHGDRGAHRDRGDRGDDRERGDRGARSRRVVLLTDGIANTGVADAGRIAADASEAAGASIDIATIGVGRDLDTALLQRLATDSRGLFHFVADAADVQKVFVAEAEALLSPVARDVRVELELPSTAEIVHVFHEGAERSGQRVTVRLPNLNAGVTGVVMVRCRARADRATERAPSASLSFRSVATGERTTTRTAPPADAPPAAAGTSIDLEVRKNAAIAVLAQGLAELAAAADERRWSDANRALLQAQDDAARVFPGADDDVQKVRDMVADHGRTLRRHLERFREF